MKPYKKISFLCLFLTLFTFSACNLVKPIEKLPNEKPKDFGFVFNYGVNAKNQLDTIKGQFTKDMVSEPSITTELKLSEEEMNTIYSEMNKINILNYPESFKPKSNKAQNPFDTYSIKIIADDREKNISWVDENISDAKDAVKLRELFKKIKMIIINKEEYKKLPESKGGYH